MKRGTTSVACRREEGGICTRRHPSIHISHLTNLHPTTHIQAKPKPCYSFSKTLDTLSQGMDGMECVECDSHDMCAGYAMQRENAWILEMSHSPYNLLFCFEINLGSSRECSLIGDFIFLIRSLSIPVCWLAGIEGMDVDMSRALKIPPSFPYYYLSIYLNLTENNFRYLIELSKYTHKFRTALHLPSVLPLPNVETL